MSKRPPRNRTVDASLPEAELILGSQDNSLLDVVDNVLNKGVVLTGDITIGLAHVDLVYLRLSLLLCAADRVMTEESGEFIERPSARHATPDRSAPRAARLQDAAAAPRRRRRA
jgi:hypothetical protein